MTRHALVCLALLFSLLPDAAAQVDGSETPSVKAPGSSPSLDMSAGSRRMTFILSGAPGTTVVVLLAPESDSSALVVEMPPSGRLAITIEVRQVGHVRGGKSTPTARTLPSAHGATSERAEGVLPPWAAAGPPGPSPGDI